MGMTYEQYRDEFERLKAEVAAIPHIEQMKGWDSSAPTWVNWLRAQARIDALTAENERLHGLVNEYRYNLEFADGRARELHKANIAYQSYNEALRARISELQQP